MFSLVKNTAVLVALSIVLSGTASSGVVTGEQQQQGQRQLLLPKPTNAKFQIVFESDSLELPPKFDESKDFQSGWEWDDPRFLHFQDFLIDQTVQASNGAIDTEDLTCDLSRHEWERIELLPSSTSNDGNGNGASVSSSAATTTAFNISTNTTTTTTTTKNLTATTEPTTYLYRIVYTLSNENRIPAEEEEEEQDVRETNTDIESLARWHVTYFSLPQKQEELALWFQMWYNGFGGGAGAEEDATESIAESTAAAANGTESSASSSSSSSSSSTATTSSLITVLDIDTIQVSALSITNNNTEAPISFFYKPPTVSPTMPPSFSQVSVATSSYDLRFHTIPLLVEKNDPVTYFGNATALESLCQFFIFQSYAHITTYLVHNVNDAADRIGTPSCQANLNGQPSINDGKYNNNGRRRQRQLRRQRQRQLPEEVDFLSYDVSLLITMRWESWYEDLTPYPFEFWKYLDSTIQNNPGGLADILESYYDLPPVLLKEEEETTTQEQGSSIFEIQSFKRTVSTPTTTTTNPPTTMTLSSVHPSFAPTSSTTTIGPSSPPSTTTATNPPSSSPTRGGTENNNNNSNAPLIAGVVVGYVIFMSASIFWFVQYWKKQKEKERCGQSRESNKPAGDGAGVGAASAQAPPETRIGNENASHPDINTTYSSSCFESPAAAIEPPEVEEGLEGPTPAEEPGQQQQQQHNNNLLHSSSATMKVGEGSVRPGEVPEMTEVNLFPQTEHNHVGSTTAVTQGAVEEKEETYAPPPPPNDNGGNCNDVIDEDAGRITLPLQPAPPPMPVRSSILDLPPGESSMQILPPAPPSVGTSGEHHQDEFDQYQDTNMERLRSNVITNVPTLDHRMSRAVTNDLINPDDGSSDEERVELSQISGIQIEAEVFWEVTEWLKHNKASSHDDREEHMQELLNKMVRCVRKGKVSPEEASQTIHGVAVLLELQVSHKLPPTILLKGMVKSTTDQDVQNAFKEFGEIAGAAVASGNKGFGIVRFRKDKHAALAMQQYDVEIRDVLVTRELLQS